jgi:hypothetical protein
VAKENAKRLGVGERATEVQLEEVSFNALRDLFLSQDFNRVRPAPSLLDLPEDPLVTARREGNSATAAFLASLPKRGDRFEAVLKDIASMANGEGGLIVIGMEASLRKKVAGVDDAEETAAKLASEIDTRIAPKPAASITVESLDGKDIIRVQVAKGADAPYAFEGAQFLVREGTETRAATRDEIVTLARRGYEKPKSQEHQRHEPRQHSERQQHQPRQQHEQRRHGERQQAGQPQQQQRQPEQRDQQNQQRQQGGQPDQRQQRQPDQQRQQQQRDQQSQQRQQGGQPDQRQQRQPDQQRQQGGQQQRQPDQRQQPAQQQPERVEQLPPKQEPAGALPAPKEQPQLPPVRMENGNGQPKPAESAPLTNMPRTGVQVTAMEERNGVEYFTVRDLRNNSIIRNVTRKSARDLWQYAITQHAEHPSGPADIDWRGDRAVLGRELRAGKVRNDVAMRDANGNVQVFYGVTDDGLDGTWKDLIGEYAAAHPVEMPEAPPPDESAPIEQQPQ